MTEQILSQYQVLNQQLKQVPRNLQHRFCYENGFKSDPQGYLLPRSQSARVQSKHH
ncbi:hypothetical protein [Vibrio cholerae]|uniref:hypothetical protein n=1 Tax=Vibrio cholerae TaxID=666 RepID=UPI000B1B9B99|nr:hypothetical protein [Vibrio cholerae]